MGELFGTDGIRGLANDLLTPELALAVAAAAATVMTSGAPGRRPIAVVGRDPRASGEMLEAAIVAGLTSTGVDVVRVGVLPTPAVAFLTADLDADLGVMLSASHNPMPDNGIKIFAVGGRKLPDEVEAEIEARIAVGGSLRPTGSDIGRVSDVSDGAKRYAEHLLAAVPASLAGLRVVVDCANGAASQLAPEVYRRAGAEVTVIGADPDGLNINDGCGSTHLEPLVAAVLRTGADIGIAHDGDADRCLAVAADGSIVDGDQILAICAVRMRDAGRLAQDTVVATVMSNLGFHHAMRDAGITVVAAPVGDRYVLEELNGRMLNLGGEQSGHVIFTDSATTGDGILTALHILAAMAGSGRPLAELAGIVSRLPQVLLNVRVIDKHAVASSDEVRLAVGEAAAELGDAGRILLRPSGTEQLVRVMVEAPSEQQAHELADRVAKTVAAAT
ncbi:MAG: phosphoglucosamine mutase [Jatrophihabitans sp.]